MTQLVKAACFTDIHFGRKQNSEQHNQDCLNFIHWFCEQVKQDKAIDHIVFLGDWHEQRAAINGLTLDFSYRSAQILNDLGLPIYMIVGNHDLYYRHNRNIYSTTFFQSLDNFILIDKPKVFEELGNSKTLISAFLFPQEYTENYTLLNSMDVVFGHFEFKGYVITGEDTVVMEHGPDSDDYNKPKRIFTGHFHKRQGKSNVQYIGSTFPMDFSDANDVERGMMVYDYLKDDVKFIDWPDCPTYTKTTLSSLLTDHKKILKNGASVKCLADQDITLEESNKLREKFVTKYNLREFTFEEQSTTEIIEDTDMDLSGLELESTTSIVTTLLGRIKETKIKPDKLIKIYKETK